MKTLNFSVYRLQQQEMQRFEACAYSGLVVTAMLILQQQPDAAQASAFGLASLILLWLNRSCANWFRLTMTTFITIAVLLTWRQADPLLPVAHVERIIHLAINLGLRGIIASTLAILCVFSPFIYFISRNRKKSTDRHSLAVAFLAYVVMQFIATEMGNFPVPVLGAGISYVLGHYIMVALVIVNDSRTAKNVSAAPIQL